MFVVEELPHMFSVHSPSIATNPNLDPRTFVRLCHDKILTDEQCDEIIAENAKREQERKEAWLNMPILPQSGNNEYRISTKEIPYGGTNGNPVTEGIQHIVTMEVYDDYNDRSIPLNFYNKNDLNKFISELQNVADHLS